MSPGFLATPSPLAAVPDQRGRYGDFGGRFIPETLMSALCQLDEEYQSARRDAEFQQQLTALLRDFVGRPSPLYFARRLTDHCGGSEIWFKREDVNRRIVEGLLKFYLIEFECCKRVMINIG